MPKNKRLRAERFLVAVGCLVGLPAVVAGVFCLASVGFALGFGVVRGFCLTSSGLGVVLTGWGTLVLACVAISVAGV